MVQVVLMVMILAATLPLSHPASAAESAVLVGAGDIATCGGSGDEATATLLDGISGTVFTTGDSVYDKGTAEEFAQCYAPSWGRHKARTRPAAGNHEYYTPGASGYYGYFGSLAGSSGRGYYSYNRAGWHIVVLNSTCGAVGGCEAGSPQERWLRADLAAHPGACTAAYWHQPRYSSGDHGGSASVQPFWQALYEYGAEVVLTGHDHHYERFAPLDAVGNPDSAYGIRQFVIGMGGRSHYAVGAPVANSVVRNSDTFGVLKLTLRAGAYDWRFVPEAGRTYADSGSGACHAPRVWPAPVVTAPVHSFVPGSTLGTSTVPVQLRWSGSDATGTISSYTLQQSTNGGAWASIWKPSATATSVVRSLAPDSAYQFRVRAVDDAGNQSAWASGQSFALDSHQESGSALAYGGAWSATSSSDAFGGGVRYAEDAAATVRLTFTGRNVAWVATTGPDRGASDVIVDGRLVRTVDLYAAQGQPRRIAFSHAWSAAGQHEIAIRVVGTPSRPRVDMDALVVAR
jgi:hypothetical protein